MTTEEKSLQFGSEVNASIPNGNSFIGVVYRKYTPQEYDTRI
jgi:hypothetical protein